MKRKMILPGEFTLAAGIVLISLAVTLMVKADLGISTISSVPYALSVIFYDVSFGAWNIFFQVGLLIILVAVTKRFKPGYLVSFLITISFGFIIDLFARLMVWLPTGLEYRLLYFVASYPIMCLGISLMVGSKIPLMIADSFIVDLTAFFHTTFRRMKTLMDIAFVATSAALGLAFVSGLAGVGVGTVIMALLTGAGVQAVNDLLRDRIEVEPWSGTLAKLSK